MYHVLRRHLTPRHSPSALVAFDLCCRELVASRVTHLDVISTSATSPCTHSLRASCSLSLYSSHLPIHLLRCERCHSRVITPNSSTPSSPLTKRPDILVGSRKLTVDCLSTTGYAVWRTTKFFKSFALGYVRVCFVCVLRTCGEF